MKIFKPSSANSKTTCILPLQHWHEIEGQHAINLIIVLQMYLEKAISQNNVQNVIKAIQTETKLPHVLLKRGFPHDFVVMALVV